MIEIKGLFGDWKEVDTKKAKEYVSFIKGTITNMTDDEKNKYINDKRLRGTTVEKLERMKI